MNKKFKKNGAKVDLTPHTHPLYPNHGHTKYDYSMAHTERPSTQQICSDCHVPKIMAAVVSLLLLVMVFAPATRFTIWEFCFALPAFISWLIGGITVGFGCPQLEKTQWKSEYSDLFWRSNQLLVQLPSPH